MRQPAKEYDDLLSKLWTNNKVNQLDRYPLSHEPPTCLSSRVDSAEFGHKHAARWIDGGMGEDGTLQHKGEFGLSIPSEGQPLYSGYTVLDHERTAISPILEDMPASM